MKLSDTNSVILFRYHKNPEQAQQSLRVLRRFNPNTAIHVLYGGSDDILIQKKLLDGNFETFWKYPEDKTPVWKWQHTDLMLKQWFRDIGTTLNFEYLFSVEYDLLLLQPLIKTYPEINQNSIALAACTTFTKDIEKKWAWTKEGEKRDRFLSFKKYMKREFNINRQNNVCLGPGPLLSRTFLEKWRKTEDIDLVHDEIAYPAYAEALGFNCVDNGLHPGFFAPKHKQKYFNCHNDMLVSKELVLSELLKKMGRERFIRLKK